MRVTVEQPTNNVQPRLSPADAVTLAAWINEHFAAVTSDPVTQLFDRLRQLGDGNVPEVDRPFDARRPDHWRRTVQAWDFFTVVGAGNRVLDIGSGDGWPALPMAHRGANVIGVEPSIRRLTVAESNAEAFESRHTQFVRQCGEQLEFRDDTFDAVTICESLEYCADPVAVLREAHRVLRPGGCLRIYAESPRRFAAAGLDHEVWFMPLQAGTWQFNLLCRDFAASGGTLLSISFSEEIMAVREKIDALRHDRAGHLLADAGFLRDLLHRVETFADEVLSCPLRYFDTATLLGLLSEAGFAKVRPTWDAGTIADRFLAGHNLEDPSHPFRDRMTAESVCASLASLVLTLPVPTELAALEDLPVLATK